MEPYSKTENYSLYLGNMLDVLDTIDENSIDSIITDPPYELNFMGKGWDNAGVSFNKNTWEKCLRVLKPGGYLIAFGGSRTYHRIACAIEDAGFEIRDTIMWLDDFEKDITDDGRNKPIDNPYLRGKTLRHNTHPTVKPTTLMQYLIRLVSPKGATILDPFMGSGSTGKAVMYENKERDADYKFIGIEMTEEYLPIAQARIEHAKNS